MLTTHKPVSSPKSAEDKLPLPLPVIIAAIILLIGIIGFTGYRFLVPPAPSISQELGMDKSSFPNWVNDAAMQCKGDMSKLSPDLQQKITAQYKDGGRTEIMASYALQTH